MRWLRAISGALAVKARQTADYSLSLIPAYMAGALWSITSAFLSLATDAYGKNAVVYACIRRLCEAISEPPLLPYTENRDGTLDPLPPDHDLVRLIRQPNELMTEQEMWELIELQVSIAGASYWWKHRANGGQIVGLWPLRPDRVAPVYSKSSKDGERHLAGWAYAIPGEGTPRFIPRSEIVAYGLPDPAGEGGGIVEFLGPLQILAREVEADNEATSMVGAWLKNNAQPSLLLKTKTPIRDKDVAKRLKAQFYAELGDSHRGSVALVDADAEIEKLSFNLRELEFPDLRALSESRIAAVFGVPAVLVGLKVGLDKSTYNNFEGWREYFADTTCSTRWRRYQSQFTIDVAAEFGDGIVCRFDTSQVKALAAQRARAAEPIRQGFENSAVMIDEYREKVLGLPPLPNGAGQVVKVVGSAKFLKPEELLKEPAPPPMLPPGQPPALPPGQTDDEPQEDEPEHEEAEDDEPPARKAIKALTDDVQARADETRDRQAADLEPKVRQYLSDQLEQIVSAWNETAKAWPSADDLIGGDDDTLRVILREAWGSTLSDATDDAGLTLGVGLSFDLENEWVQDTLDQVGERVRGISDTTREALRTIISAAASEGLSVPQVAERIRAAGAFGEARAETIARTETALAYSSGTLRAYQESGLVAEVEVLDGDFDETCQGLNGQRKSLEWANANLIQHPRCRRAFSPILR